MFLDGAFKGLAYIFTFEWQALFKLEVWYKAAAQVLFQLSISKLRPSLKPPNNLSTKLWEPWSLWQAIGTKMKV